MDSLEWMHGLDPETFRSLFSRTDAASVTTTENHAVTLLCDLLEFGQVKFSTVSTLTVNWGDGSPVERFGPERDIFDPDHAHYFAKDGQYNVLIAVGTGGGAPANFCRLILQVRNTLGEVVIMRPTDLD